MTLSSSASRLAHNGSGDEIHRHLRAAIQSGELKSGQRIASIRTLQKTFGASLHAVVKCIDRLEEEQLIERRRATGIFVRARARRPAGNAANVKVDLLADHGRSPSAVFMEPMVAGIRSELEHLGATLEERPLNIALRTTPAFDPRVNAAIWVTGSLPPELVLPQALPIILVSHACDGVPAGANMPDVVTSDARQGGALAGRHLRECGCREAHFVGVWDEAKGRWEATSQLRLEGFEEGWGKRLNPVHLLRTVAYTSHCATVVVGNALREGTKLDGLFAASDDLAMGICHAAAAHNVEPGRDFKLVGFDGQPGRFSGDPDLTTVRVPLEALGRKAAQLALERAGALNAPSQRIALGCSLKKGVTA